MTLKSTGPNLTAENRVKIVAENASGVTINHQIKASVYIKTGKEMLRTAANYQEDGSIENAYILYTRFLTLFLEKIRTHPGYNDLPLADRKLMRTFCTKALPQAEALKTQLTKKYKVEHEAYLRGVELVKKRMETRASFEDLKNKEGYGNDTSGQVSSVSRSGVSSGSSGSEFDSSSHEVPTAPPLAATNPGDYMDDDQWNKFTEGSTGTSFPQFDRSTKPSRLLSPIASGLRPVIVPGDLVSHFLRIADSNTKLNIETCGHLTGRIFDDKLVITHLIIPKQKGTSDSCTTENEEDLINIQDKLNLLTMGWIHTHPSQTAFLSSVDLHTHFSYQTMLPESIAIVCAPTYSQVGNFMLTPSVGMDVIANCRAEGFHPHESTKVPLFQEATHTVLDNTRKTVVHDVRFTKAT